MQLLSCIRAIRCLLSNRRKQWTESWDVEEANSMRAAFLAIVVLACTNTMLAQNPSTLVPGGGRGPAGASGAQFAKSPTMAGPMSSKDIPPWAAIRTGAELILHWRIGVPLSSFPRLTFADAVVKADALNIGSVQGV